MRKPLQLAVALVLAASVLSCTAEREAEQRRDLAEEAALERAEEVAQALAGELMQRLQREMRSGGPAEAVRVCSEVAQQLAAVHSGDGVTVRRVSLKLRNPADRPDSFERDALLELQELHDEGRLPDRMTRIVAGEEGRELRYLRPIRIMPTCLGCHGPAASLDPEVARIIAGRYPDDQATGYATGDLRGAISVTVALE